MEQAILERAQAGEEQAFRALVEPYRRELQVHCYRLTGSLADAEDLLQETLLAAWRGLAGFQQRSSLRSWLYRIATNQCLNALRAAGRRIPASPVPPFQPPEPTRRSEITWLQPYPDALLEGIADTAPGPEARYQVTEAIELAFVAGLQRMPPRQAATLVLRDVLGYPAEEAAAMLGTSPVAVKGTLQRARAALDRSRGESGGAGHRLPSQDERVVARRFADAYVAADIDGVIALLTDDAWLSMPPAPHEYGGHAAIRSFLQASFGFRGDRRIQLVPIRANTQAALASYIGPPGGTARPGGLFVLGLNGARIRAVTRFHVDELYPRFGLPESLPASAGERGFGSRYRRPGDPGRAAGKLPGVRAIVVREAGGPSALRLEELPTPSPGPDEVTVDVVYAGTGFVDTLFRSGALPVPMPFVPGIEVTGRVREVGEGVTDLAPGDAVGALLNDFGRGWRAGGYAAVAVAHRTMTVPLPSGADLARVTAVLINGVTAWLALRDLARTASTDSVVVLGASGGLGGTACRLAALLPARRVTGVVSRDVSRAPAACTDVVLSSEFDGWIADPANAPDVVIDPVGGELRAAAFGHLAPFGRQIILGNATGDDRPLSGDGIWHGSRTVSGLSLGATAHLVAPRIQAALYGLVDLLQRGALDEPRPAVAALGEAAAVHQAFADRTAPPKTVLDVSA